MPEPGPTFETKEEARVALQTTVLRELRKVRPGRFRTDRFRLALIVTTWGVLQ